MEAPPPHWIESWYMYCVCMYCVCTCIVCTCIVCTCIVCVHVLCVHVLCVQVSLTVVVEYMGGVLQAHSTCLHHVSPVH